MYIFLIGILVKCDASIAYPENPLKGDDYDLSEEDDSECLQRHLAKSRLMRSEGTALIDISGFEL